MARAARPGRLRDLSTHSSYHDGFAPVRLLERLGLVRLDADDAYVLAFISGVGNQGRDSAASCFATTRS